MRITQEQIDILNLINRSKSTRYGWKQCAPIIFEKLITSIPDDLVEKDYEKNRVRFTKEGSIVVKWVGHE